ncbi:OvmZ protein [Streptomyces sp. NPDC006976]|uniref:OvmZ protein n=1 Tax=Streptomyces sp. NPDC006976 TaxID=3154311 RepID=UPI0033FD1543
MRDVKEVYRDSEEELAVLSGGPVERVSGTQPVGLRLDDRMLTLRSQVTDLLCSWAGLVVSERGLPPVPGTEVPTLLRFLAGHVRWLAEHPAAQDLDAELTALLESARSLLGPRSYEVSLGVCCHSGCTARLHATLSGTRDSVYSQVACDAGHTVPPREWLLLSGRTRQDTDRTGGAA